MAFIFERSDPNDRKIRFRLSDTAMTVKESDMFLFGVESENAYLNRVFWNFYQDAEASVSLCLQKNKDYLNKVLSSLDDKAKEKAISILEKEKEKELLNKVEERRAKRGEGKDVLPSVHKEIFTYLTSRACCEEKYYDNAIPKYFQSVIEEYARKPYYKRERIYYQHVFDSVDFAISKQQQLHIFLANAEKGYDVSPYKITTDPLSMHHYLIGLLEPQKLFVCRATNIKDSKDIQNRKIETILDEDGERFLESEIKKKGAPFLSRDTIKAHVYLTEKGIKNYNQMSHLRPRYSEIRDNNIYVFFCTKDQLEFFFFKFGKDAVIIEPKSLAEEFKRKYEDAAKAYGNI